VIGCESICSDVKSPEFVLSLILLYEVLCLAYSIIEFVKKIILF
jgi:hypothetical protein